MDTTVVPIRHWKRKSLQRGSGVLAVLVIVVLAVVAATLGAAWSASGGTLAPAGTAVGRVDVATGSPTYVGFQLMVTGGSVEIDGVRLEDGDAWVEGELTIANEGCAVGIVDALPDGCEDAPAPGAVVHPGDTRFLVGRFVLTEATEGHVGAVVVSYHDGLHRRETGLNTTVCLSPAPDGCNGN